MKTFVLAALGLIAAGLSSMASAQAIITNGTISLGVNSRGSLVYNGVGITVNRNGSDGLAPGCDCEGWGAGVIGITNGNGYTGPTFGTSNVALTSFSSTASTAQSVTTIGSALRVTHDFAPSAATPYLYAVTVSIQNISGSDFSAGALRYRRTMDWDIPPTEFREVVTIQGVPAALGIANGSNVLSTGNNGFATADALASSAGTIAVAGCSATALLNRNFVDCGPGDHGADFIFQFGALAAGATQRLTIYYGAAPSEAEALAALTAVGSGLYSLGQASGRGREITGTPDTFIFGFAVRGGVVVDPPPPPPPSGVPAPGALALLALGLGLLARQRRA